MSEYDELVKRLRSFGVTTRGIMVGHVHDAADVIQALQSEVDRLKGVLGDIKRNADCGGDAGLFRWQTLSEITKALEAKP